MNNDPKTIKLMGGWARNASKDKLLLSKRRHGPTYSPGEKIWIGIYLAFMCIVALIIF